MLEDLIGSPTILSCFGIMHVLPVCQDLSLPAVQTPREDDFMFTATTIRTGKSLVECGETRHTEFERNLLL
jgi:hypothetical protein